ncbi:hypothetical protein BDN72DRAFT_884299, partial [Pluteus cervinus]
MFKPALLLIAYATTTFGAAVYYCTNANWGGDCHLTPPITGTDVCHNLEGGVQEFNDQISSFGPDSGLYCVAFKNYDCHTSDGDYTITYPGVSDLSIVPGWNDVISSYICNQEAGSDFCQRTVEANVEINVEITKLSTDDTNTGVVYTVAIITACQD